MVVARPDQVFYDLFCRMQMAIILRFDLDWCLQALGRYSSAFFFSDIDFGVQLVVLSETQVSDFLFDFSMDTHWSSAICPYSVIGVSVVLRQCGCRFNVAACRQEIEARHPNAFWDYSIDSNLILTSISYSVYSRIGWHIGFGLGCDRSMEHLDQRGCEDDSDIFCRWCDEWTMCQEFFMSCMGKSAVV